ncbi:MAG TPA: pilus assembly protein PilM [Syntrophorhabdaceae bacterium]|nr:pilus assembly protein PilM [Syntrophorhabdaceae bacterium]
MDIIGIDIGSVRIKYVRMQRKSKRIIIVSKDSFDYKGTFDDLSEIIGSIAVKEGTNNEIVVGITSQEIFKKSFTVPIMPKEEIKEAVKWSASKVISTPVEDTYYEFDIIGDIEERGIKKRDIFFAGIEKDYANKVVSLFMEKGFEKITLLTDSSFVYAPYIKDINPELSVVVDIGGRVTGIYIIENGKNMFFREILTASESFTDALMSGFNFSYDEAEHYKREKGFVEDSEPILSVTLERLAGEIQRTFSVFLQKYVDKKIRHIYFTGGGSKIPNLIEKLKNFFEEEAISLPLLEEIEDTFLPAYLLCLKKTQLFNLLPYEIRSKKKEENQKKWLRIGTVGLLSVIVIITINMFGKIKKLESNINMEKMLVSNNKQKFAQLSGSVFLSKDDEFVQLFSEIKKKDLTYLSLLKYLSSKLPKNVSLKEVYLELHEKTTVSQKTGQTKIPEKPQDSLVKQDTKATEDETYIIRIKGYIFGEKNLLESELLEFIIRLEGSGFIYMVDVVGKDLKTLKGKGVMEFELKGRCAVHEI